MALVLMVVFWHLTVPRAALAFVACLADLASLDLALGVCVRSARSPVLGTANSVIDRMADILLFLYVDDGLNGLIDGPATSCFSLTLPASGSAAAVPVAVSSSTQVAKAKAADR